MVRLRMVLSSWVLVGALAAAPACGLGAGQPPTITVGDQERVRSAAVKALAGLEVAGVIVRDARQMVSDLAAAGVVPMSVRDTTNMVVIKANAVVQRVITQLALATRTAEVSALVQQARGAVEEVATMLEASSDTRVQTAGRLLRVALMAVGGVQ